MNNENQIVPMSDIEKMGNAIAKSGLFGMKTPEQAIALMLVAQAEGLHPAIAARDYHIIEGRPALKADAMLARFHTAGGKVEWIEYTDTKVSAKFSHQQGGTVVIDWDIEKAKKAEVYKEKTSTGKTGMWVKYPRQMLKARVISEGIRATFPGVNSGFYTPEEVQDFDEPKKQHTDTILLSSDRKKKLPVETTAEIITTPDVKEGIEAFPIDVQEYFKGEMQLLESEKADVNGFLTSLGRIAFDQTWRDLTDKQMTKILSGMEAFKQAAIDFTNGKKAA